MQTNPLRRTLSSLQERLVGFWRRARRLKFRQVMGFILMVKTFNPLLFLLALFLFAFLLVRDIQKQYQPALDQISSNYKLIVNDDFKGLKTAVGEASNALKDLGAILGVIRDVVNAVVGFVNVIINAIAWFFGMSKIHLGIHLPIPDFSALFRPFSNLSLHTQGLFSGIAELFNATLTILGNLWARLKLFVILGAAWAVLSIFASGYSEFTRGLEMMRGAPDKQVSQPAGAHETRAPALTAPHLDTPPVLIVDQVQVALPALLESEGQGPVEIKQRTFAYQEHVLLTAQAVWPNRSIPLFYFLLVRRVDENAWAFFWQSLIERGLEPQRVRMVVSGDIKLLAPSLQRFLPRAELHQSVETTFISQ
jgi:hypothetical protein